MILGAFLPENKFDFLKPTTIINICKGWSKINNLLNEIVFIKNKKKVINFYLIIMNISVGCNKLPKQLHYPLFSVKNICKLNRTTARSNFRSGFRAVLLLPTTASCKFLLSYIIAPSVIQITQLELGKTKRLITDHF